MVQGCPSRLFPPGKGLGMFCEPVEEELLPSRVRIHRADHQHWENLLGHSWGWAPTPSTP